MKITVHVLYSIMYRFKGWQNNRNHAFPSKRCLSNEKSVIVTHFTMKIIRTHLYIACKKKILFVKKHLNLLWVFIDFCILLNTNTAVTQQLIWTTRMLEAEWWQICGEEWVRGQRRWVKYWMCLGCWISPCYGLFVLGACFETYEPFISLNFQFFFFKQQ
jgi:hypothetical protein